MKGFLSPTPKNGHSGPSKVRVMASNNTICYLHTLGHCQDEVDMYNFQSQGMFHSGDDPCYLQIVLQNISLKKNPNVLIFLLYLTMVGIVMSARLKRTDILYSSWKRFM